MQLLLKLRFTCVSHMWP